MCQALYDYCTLLQDPGWHQWQQCSSMWWMMSSLRVDENHVSSSSLSCSQLCTLCEKTQQWRFLWCQVIITTAARHHHMGVPAGIRMFSTAGRSHTYSYRHLAKHRGLFGRGFRLSIWADCRLNGGWSMDLIRIAGVVEPAAVLIGKGGLLN